MSRRSISTFVALVCALLLAWIVWSVRVSDGAAPIEAGDLIAEAVRAPDFAALTVPEQRASDERSALANDSMPDVATREADAAVPPTFDPHARGVLTIRVIDRHSGQPIAQASIAANHLRTNQEPGSAYAWTFEPRVVRSDVDGYARLEFPVHLIAQSKTDVVGLRVTHGEYGPRSHDVAIDGVDPLWTVELERAAFVCFSGWIDTPQNVVTQVDAALDHASAVAPDDWMRKADGRPCTATLARGEHAVWLRHVDAQRAVWWSRVEFFTVEPDQQREIAVELVRACTLRGRLDARVPRPVKNGAVLLQVEVGPRGRPSSLRTFSAPIEADGTFVVRDLPPGHVQLTADADGWCSDVVPSDDPRDFHFSGSAERVREEIAALGADAATLPWLTLPFDGDSDGEFIVPMIESGALSVLVRDVDGRPIANAAVSISPNVQWRNGWAQIWMNRDEGYTALTDAAGRARIDKLPPGSHPFNVGAARLTLVSANEREFSEVTIEAGAERTLELTMTRDAR